MRARLPSERSEVQTPPSAEIWIEISVSCAPLLWNHKSVDIPEPVSSLELTYSEEGRVERKGADALVVKKKRERNPMTHDQKRRPKINKTCEKGERKKH